MSCRLFGVSIAVASWLTVLARAQAPHSTQLATELDSLLTARRLDAIVAADPEEPNRFVAAFSYPKSQLRSRSPSRIDATLDAVFMASTLELFPEDTIPIVLTEVRRTLSAGGRLSFFATAHV
jgi:hypothetical protein